VFFVAVVMPVFNESDGLAETLRELELIGIRSDVHLNLFIQDDVSDDDSLEVIEAYQCERFSLFLETNSRRLGHGPSVRRGYERAVDSTSDVIVQLDGDGQFHSEDVVHLIQRIRSGMKFILATRTHRSGPAYRRLATHSLRILCRVLFRTKSADVNSPIRAFDPGFLAGILPLVPQDSVMTNVHLSLLSFRCTHLYETCEVVDQVRRGKGSQGSTWKSAEQLLSPVFRFLRLAASAFTEVISIRYQFAKKKDLVIAPSDEG
jgi:glycosyltransferase involved in cell wall biosynthesis